MPDWLPATLVGISSGLLGSLVTAVWLLAGINKDVERMKEDIGTSDKGMRATVHKSANAIISLEGQVRSLAERLDSLHGWKHRVGDAYLPRAVDEHERRLDRLDAKVFNGTHK